MYREVAAEGFATIPRNLRWIGTLTEVAHCAADLEDASGAEALLELLTPFEHRHSVMPIAICYGGPVSWAMARLQELLARADEADSLYRTALHAASVLGARPTQAQIHLSHGRFLRRRRLLSQAREHLEEAAALATEHGMVTVENDARRLLT